MPLFEKEGRGEIFWVFFFLDFVGGGDG